MAVTGFVRKTPLNMPQPQENSCGCIILDVLE